MSSSWGAPSANAFTALRASSVAVRASRGGAPHALAHEPFDVGLVVYNQDFVGAASDIGLLARRSPGFNNYVI